MIMFPKSENTYTNEVAPAQRVIIDGINCGDLSQLPNEWHVILTGRVANGKYGNGVFSSREFAVEYIKCVYHAWASSQR